jgi:hypothetical protein
MTKAIVSGFLLLSLTACSGYAVTFKSSSACSSDGESSYGCQVERYNAIGGR